MMESIEKLRDTSLKFAPNIRRDVNMALDEIEREIAERYMELPVDADGMPIHMGDLVADNREPSKPYKVDRFHVYDDGEWSIGVLGDPPFNLRHVKPRTLENVLCDLVHDSYTMSTAELVGKYAAELRELMGNEQEG